MCFSKDASLFSFVFGIFSSLALIIYGNFESSDTNKAIGYFFMFVCLMQLIEYLIWKDINCQIGLNKLGSMIGPIFNHLQPIIFLIVASIFLKSQNIIPHDLLVLANILYLCYVIYKYGEYIQNPDNLCTHTNDLGHLDWNWKNNYNYIFYFVMNILNFINYYDNINISTSFGLSYLLLFISITNFNQNIGEFWCLLVTGIPLANLILQKIFNVNN